MFPHSGRQCPDTFALGLLAFTLVFGWLFLLHDVGFGLGDEGYLWNNALLTFDRGVPIRDFRSYDPGRYYWVAMWFHLLGPSLLALRLSMAIVQFVGFFAGLLVLRRAVPNLPLLLSCGILLLLYLYPRVKIFEAGCVLVALLCAVRLVEEPNRGHHFISGVVVGLAAFWAKNFGVYLGVGFLFLIVYRSWGNNRHSLRLLGVWLLGIVAGYSPMIVMWCSVPGFLQSFLDANWRLFGPTAPVKALPIPWPWHYDASQNTAMFLLGLAYITMYSGYAISLLAVVSLRAGRSPLLAAATFLGIPLLHHASIRADFNHFAISVAPFLYLLLARYPGDAGGWLKVPVRTASLVVLALLSWLLLVSSSEIKLAGEKIRMLAGQPSTLEAVMVDGRALFVARQEAVFLTGLRQCFVPELTDADRIFVGPYTPGLYFFLRKKSPIWDAFPIHAAGSEEQEKEIAQLKAAKVEWALVSNAPLDGIAERRFSLTHPKVWQYLLEHFDPVECTVLAVDQQLLRARH